MDYQRLAEFALQSKLSDFTIELPASLSNVKIPAHRIILASNSPLFYSLFESDPSVAEYKTPTPVNSINGETTEDFINAILRFGYSQQTLNGLIESGLKEANAFRFYSAANILDFSTAKKLIRGFIEQRNFVDDNIITSLYESIKFEEHEWVFALIKMIALNFNNFVRDVDNGRGKLVNLPFEHIKALLSRDDLYVENEDLVFSLVIDYIKHREGLEDRDTVLGLEKPVTSTETEPEAKKDNKKESTKNTKEEEAQGVKDLEAAALLLLANYKLSYNEKKELLNMIRLKFVSHKTLIDAVREPVVEPFKDIILEAISAKLSAYENPDADYSITLQPRDCYSEEKLKAMGNTKNFAKTSQVEQVKPFSERMAKTDTIAPRTEPLHQSNVKEVKEDTLKEHKTLHNANFLDNTLRNEKTGSKIDFTFAFNFDENGAFYWLGTFGKTRKYANPYTTGLVKVFFSSISEKSRYDDFVGRSLENCRTGNQMNSYMGVDLGSTR